MKTEAARSQPGYAGSPTSTGLTIFWLEVLEMAHAGDDDAVAQRLAMLALRREDLDVLFGPGASARFWAEYARAFASFAGEGARDIADKIRARRYDDVEVFSQSNPVDSGLLRTNAPVYTVRLKRSEENDGIRIDTFIYLDDSWRTALKVGRT